LIRNRVRLIWISVVALATAVATLGAAACGSTPSSPSTPPQHQSAAPNEDVTLTGRIVGTVTGEPIAGATVTVGAESFVTDDHGVFSLTGTSPDVRDVTIAGAGLVTRVSRVSFADRDVTLDVIQERPPFNLAFFRELGRNAFESTTGLEPLRPIPNAPRVHIRTVDETGQAMDAALLDLVEAALRDVASTWSAGRYPLEVVTRGPETKFGQSGWVTVLFSGQGESGGCGRATLGSATGRIELNHLNSGCACGDNVIAPRTVRHELGHIYGYWHTAVRGGVMSSTWTTRQCNSRPSSREIEHAKYMYSRPNGNTDPDTDPVGRVLHTADEIVIED
jgi:hypothetical protein